MNKVAADAASARQGERHDQTSVAETIQRNFNRLTRAERKAARVLQAHYPMVGLEPLSGYAERAGVSHPSILRFIAKLGYSGYADFQAALRYELEARLKSPLAKRHPSAGDAEGSQGLPNRHAEAVCQNIRQSVAAVPRAEFDGALELLGDARNRVYLLGGRFTDSLAVYVYMHLRVLRPQVGHITGPPVSWPEYLVDMDRRTVLLVFDIRRYQQEVIRFASAAAERGARIILMTDTWLSPIAAQARHVLSARIEATSSWDSIVALSTLAEALIAGLSERNWAQTEQRILELEKLRGHFENTDDGS